MLVLKFLSKRKDENDEGPSQYKKIKLSKLTLMLEDLESGKETEDVSLSDKHKKREEDFEVECTKQSNVLLQDQLGNSYKRFYHNLCIYNFQYHLIFYIGKTQYQPTYLIL